MKKISLLLVVTVCLLAGLSGMASSAAPQFIKGGSLPDFTLPAPQNSSERNYLGLSGSGPFRVSDIKADIVVVQVYSMYCPHCQKDAPNMNSLFSKIESDPALKGRIKILGIGAGNSQFEVETFRKRYNVPFALIPDPDFKVHDLLGRPRTPSFMIVKLQPAGREKLVDTHLGAYESPDKLLNDVLRPALKEGR